MLPLSSSIVVEAGGTTTLAATVLLALCVDGDDDGDDVLGDTGEVWTSWMEKEDGMPGEFMLFLKRRWLGWVVRA